MYSRNSDVYISYMVASRVCEVTLILTQKRPLLLCVRISVTSQAQLATTTSSYFCCK